MGKSSDTIRQGVISSVNYEKGRVRVLYSDRNDAVSPELPMQTFEYDMPKVGEEVYVLHQSNGVEKGVVISRYYRDNEEPVESGGHIWRKELRDEAGSFLKFDRNTHTLFINVAGSPDVSVSINSAMDVKVTSGGSVDVSAAKDVRVMAGETVNINAAKDVRVTAGENIYLDAKNVFFPGGVMTSAGVTVEGAVKAAEGVVGQPGREIILTRHKHTGVEAGAGTSSVPEAPTT